MARQGIIIGGGASGLTAAIAAAEQGASVTVLEHMPKMGKKLLSTGNGRCNLTNTRLEADCYRSDCAGFPMQVLSRFTPKDTMKFFRRLGVVTESVNGYIYPRSMQARTVLDALLDRCEELGVTLRTDVQIGKIRKENGRFFISADQGVFDGDFLILAAGSRAAAHTGSDGSGYELARQFGHRVIEPVPALVQLRCREKYFRSVAGVRCEAKVTVFVSGSEAASDTGELQLTEYGISGIPVFQVSRFASRALAAGKSVTAELNFLPELEQAEVFSLLREQKKLLAGRKSAGFLTGIFNQKIAALLIRQAGIGADQPVKTISGKQFSALCRLIQAFPAEVESTNSFEQAQVCAGGVDGSEICAATMESRKEPGLYLAGELVDVDGICGGYNLQWAWASGFLAGRSAAGKD